MVSPRLLSLLYHDIRTGDRNVDRAGVGDAPYVLDRGTFEAQISLLGRSGFKSVTSSDLIGFFRHGRPLPKKAALITFDDGHRSNFTEALPVLERHGFKGVFFVTTGWIGRDDMMSWEQLSEMNARGMEIGSHTDTHAVPALLPDKELKRELVESRRKLESKLDIEVRSVSSPTGFHDRRMMSLARETGYSIMCVGTTLPVPAPLARQGPYWINRTDIKSNVSMASFDGLVRGSWSTSLRLHGREYLLGRAKSLLGPGTYSSLRLAALGVRTNRRERPL